MQKAPGSVFLLVTGILYAILGGLGVLGGLLAMVGSSAVSILGGAVGVSGAGATFGFYALVSLLLSGFSVFVGVMGITGRNSYDKANLLMTLGIANFALGILSTLIWGSFSLMTIVFWAIPICYIFGAFKNKTAY